MFNHIYELNKSRVPGLDLVRSLAILLVLIAHSRTLLKPFGFQIEYMSIAGFFGVEMFFVLSGFLIGGILLRMTKNRELSLRDVRIFWIRRWFRTLPNYYLILAINLVLFSFISELEFDWRFLFFVQNFITPHPLFFAEAWSLSIEEWFYLIFPIVVFLLIRLSAFEKHTILFSCLLMISGCLGLRIIHYFWMNPEWAYGFRQITPLRLDAIAVGILTRYFVEKTNFISSKWTLILFILFLIHISFHYYNFILGKSTELVGFYSKTFYFLSVSTAFALMILLVRDIKLRSSKITKWIIVISTISYSMYLIHYNLVLYLLKKFFRPDSPIESIAVVSAYFLITFYISGSLYLFFERPITLLRDKIAKE